MKIRTVEKSRILELLNCPTRTTTTANEEDSISFDEQLKSGIFHQNFFINCPTKRTTTVNEEAQNTLLLTHTALNTNNKTKKKNGHRHAQKRHAHLPERFRVHQRLGEARVETRLFSSSEAHRRRRRKTTTITAHASRRRRGGVDPVLVVRRRAFRALSLARSPQPSR